MFARASGMARSTVRIGTSEIDQGPELTRRARRPGAGRPKATVHDPGLLAALDALVEPTARGDPESPLRWTCKSTHKLADELGAQGHRVSSSATVRALTRCPCAPSSSASLLVDLHVHRNGDSGSPRAVGSTRASKAASSPGSCTVALGVLRLGGAPAGSTRGLGRSRWSQCGPWTGPYPTRERPSRSRRGPAPVPARRPAGAAAAHPSVATAPRTSPPAPPRSPPRPDTTRMSNSPLSPKQPD